MGCIFDSTNLKKLLLILNLSILVNTHLKRVCYNELVGKFFIFFLAFAHILNIALHIIQLLYTEKC